MRSVLAAFYSHPWAWNEIGFGGPAYPRGYMRLAEGPPAPNRTRRAKRSASIPSQTSDRRGHAVKTAVKRLAKGAVGPPDNDSRFLLDVHTRGLPGRATMAALPRRGRGRPGDRRRRRGRQHAGAAPGAARLADRGPRVRPVLGPRPRLGLRRGRQPQALLDRQADDRRRRPGRAGQEQLRATGSAARWSTTPATPRASTRPTSRRTARDGVGADWPIGYRGAQAALRAGGGRAAGRRAGLAVG